MKAKEYFDGAVFTAIFALPATILTAVTYIIYGVNELSVVFSILDSIYIFTLCYEIIAGIKARQEN